MMLETERLLIRPYTLNDAEALSAILIDPITMHYWPQPFSLQETMAWIQRSISSYTQHGFGRYAIFLKEDLKLIGDCGLLQMEIQGETVIDLGYIIHHKFWRNGYASEAATAICRFAFDVLQLEYLYANMPLDHRASQRVAEKIGMQQSGAFRNPRNRNLETYLYKISKHQFANLNPS